MKPRRLLLASVAVGLVLAPIAMGPNAFADPVVATIALDSPSPNPFYPIVHDGYADRTRITWTATDPGSSVIPDLTGDVLIKRSGGRQIRDIAFDMASSLGQFPTWDGRDDDGDIQPVGIYTVAVVANGNYQGTSNAQEVALNHRVVGHQEHHADSVNAGEHFLRGPTTRTLSGNCHLGSTGFRCHPGSGTSWFRLPVAHHGHVTHVKIKTRATIRWRRGTGKPRYRAFWTREKGEIYVGLVVSGEHFSVHVHSFSFSYDDHWITVLRSSPAATVSMNGSRHLTHLRLGRVRCGRSSPTCSAMTKGA